MFDKIIISKEVKFNDLKKNEIICDCLNDIEPFIESVLPNNTEKITTDCTDIGTDDLMQEVFEDTLLA